MSQSHQSIGESSPELAAATQHPHGLQGSSAENLAQMQSDHTFSVWNVRANRQALATNGDPSYAEAFFTPGAGAGAATMAGHVEEPTAGYGAPSSGPFTGYAEDGIINGATAATPN